MFSKGRVLWVILALLVVTVAPIHAQSVGGDATGVPYELKESMYGGEPITLTIWDWYQPRIEFFNRVAPMYTELYPNVTFEVVHSPGYDDFWTKAAAAIPAGEGPDIISFHNVQHSFYVNNNLVDPYPEAMFDPAYFNENWLGFSSNHFHDAEGNIRYISYGSMAAVMYVNQAIWDEAGLTDADIPTTWDALATVSEKMTKKDSAGNIDVAGFAFNDALWAIWNDMNFQQGQYQYTADGKGCQIDTPTSRHALDTIQGWYDIGINSTDFLSANEAFGTDKAAMVYNWTWASDWLRINYPDLEFFTFKLPTFTGKDLPARGRQNYEVSTVVPSTNSEERKAVSWDFLHWLYGQDEMLVDLALLHGITPSYRNLFDNPRILEREEIHQLAEMMEYEVYPGEFPDAAINAMILLEEGMRAGLPMDDVIVQSQEQCDAGMQENDYLVAERTYTHSDAMLPEQP